MLFLMLLGMNIENQILVSFIVLQTMLLAILKMQRFQIEPNVMKIVKSSIS